MIERSFRKALPPRPGAVQGSGDAKPCGAETNNPRSVIPDDEPITLAEIRPSLMKLGGRALARTLNILGLHGSISP